MRESKRTENWNRAVFGGVMDPNQARKWLGPKYDHATRMTSDTHFTCVGPFCPALEQNPDREFTDRPNALVRKMGYQFALQEIHHSATTTKGDKLMFLSMDLDDMTPGQNWNLRRDS